jgi:catalase
MAQEPTPPETLTTNSGAPVGDNQNSITAGARGPVLLQARYNHRDGNDDYTQAGNLFRLMNSELQKRLCGNIARHMQGGNTPQEIQVRQICHFFRADPRYGSGSQRHLGWN